ncbi:Monofunctional riboflavin biosynthesis protein RIBA 3 chloroplastic [Bienertia sinuspersici]
MGSIPSPHLLFPHISNRSSIPRSLFFKYNQRWWNLGCWGSNFDAAGNLFDDQSSSSTLENENGSLKSVPFSTLDAEITPETIDFFVSDAEGDPDCPTKGYSSIEQALMTLKQGKFVIVVDDENEDEGNLVMAASLVTPQTMAFMVKHGTGIVSAGMRGEDLERLKLPLMSPESENADSSAPTFTVTVDAKVGTTTGVSASDRAITIATLASPDSKPEDFIRPGHVFPLKYRNGGVLRRAGHTEASVDLVMYRRKRERLVERRAVSKIPTNWGQFEAYCYQSKLDGIEHVALVKGNIGNGEEVLVRVHSECLTGDVFGSARCDCGNQLALAMELIEKAGRGILLYLRGHEGRGIGLGHKLQAYNLQDQGHDTVEANLELGLAADILRDIGVRTMRLMTNNPAKFTGLKGYGLAVVGRVPVLTPITDENRRYLETKRVKMGHMYGSDIQGSLAGLLDPNAINQDIQENE